MANAETNYGSTLTKGGQPVGRCMVVDYPEITISNLDGTSHQSSGLEERFPGGLRRMSEFTFEVLIASGVLETVDTELAAGTTSAVVLTVGQAVQFSFQGFYTGYKPEPSDVGSEDVAKASITIQPTGGITILSI